MNYFELDKKTLMNEIFIQKGQLQGSALTKFFDSLNNLEKADSIVKTTRKYFEEVVGLKLKKFNYYYLEDYLDELAFEKMAINPELPKIMKNKDVVSNLAYYISDKYLKMKDGVGVKYVKFDDGFNEIFFFFDSELEELFGYITLDEVDDEEPKKFCRKGRLRKVGTSMTDKEMRSTGIGKNMYLTLIEKFGCLSSDTSLFTGSLNIWVNVLPKYYKVYYYLSENDKDTIEPLTNKKPDFEDIEYFIAVKN